MRQFIAATYFGRGRYRSRQRAQSAGKSSKRRLDAVERSTTYIVNAGLAVAVIALESLIRIIVIDSHPTAMARAMNLRSRVGVTSSPASFDDAAALLSFRLKTGASVIKRRRCLFAVCRQPQPWTSENRCRRAVRAQRARRHLMSKLAKPRRQKRARKAVVYSQTVDGSRRSDTPIVDRVHHRSSSKKSGILKVRSDTSHDPTDVAPSHVQVAPR